jgi:hypothetical protein
MPTLEGNQPALNEEVWRAWVEKGKLRDQAAARRIKMFAGTILIALALGSVLYTFAVR